ncbi:amino acid transporter [Agromyces badenianii]|uniref:Amino acid transporter n=1 Tax=Agromyces badenianii TaxID=2080742 RepID=A0A2S0WZN8_9MICO|nr:LysE/ArgO family amino acid transporter [Agromyces badenianii]AWB96730.1 amino acid transporter [Agromyces badenianii]PWC03780.1 amino acid transporter [Agromyces badenianii]
MSSALAGLGLGLSLIVAIGAQNVFVLRQGIRREHVFTVAAICALSDLALILVGVSGIGAVLAAVPWLVGVIRWAGAAFLVGYGALAARRAIRPSGAALDAGASPGAGAGTLAAAALTCLALTWLNPHVYLDTVFLLGSVANGHGDERWAFAAGAGLASLVWFFGLAYGARLLGRVLASPRAWRVLDGLIALVMVTLGVLLVLPH